MLKSIPAVALLAFLEIFSQVPGKVAQHQGVKANSGKNAGTSNKPPAAPVSVQNLNSSNNPQKNCQDQARKNEQKNVTVTVPPINVKKGSWDYVYIGATLIIAVATLVLALIASSQAKAAKASSEALINSERAWVMAEIAWAADFLNVPRPTNLRLTEESGTQGERLTAHVCLTCKNDGRTPAWITEEILWFIVLHEAPSDKPDTTRPRSFSYSGPRPLSVGEPFTIPSPVECEGRRPQVGGPTLLIYGVIKYRDAFGNHETWCGYVVTGDPPRLERLAKYPEYNKNT